jgi:hypothetical protein
MAYDLERSGLVSRQQYPSARDYHREYRDMAVRYTTFHELVHVVQAEINALNVAREADKALKTAWVRSRRNILNIDGRYFRKWGSAERDAFSQVHNLTVAQESQAEGVAAKMIMEAYDLSAAQRKLFWEFRFGRLRDGREHLVAALDLMETRFPEFDPEDLAAKIGDDIYQPLPGTEEDNQQKRYGIRIARWLSTIAYYQGVLNPMTEAETAAFWDYLKPTPVLFQ